MRGTHISWLVPVIAAAALIAASVARSDEGMLQTSRPNASQAGSAGGHSSGGPGYGIAPASGIQSTVFVQPTDSFHGRDFALGAGVALSAALVAAITAGLLRTRRRLAHSH